MNKYINMGIELKGDDAMKFELKLIQDDVIKYANILARVISADVEIVDSKLNRIAGTGMFKDKINTNIFAEGYIYKNVLETGERQIIKNPGKHPLCKKCINSGNCIEKLELSSPIKLNNEIIGVIGLVCSDDKQKTVLLEKLESHLEFLDQISDFISTKVYEHKEKERNKDIIKVLKQIINTVDQGIIVTDEDSKIVHMNSSAMKQLRIDHFNLNNNIEIISKNEYIMGEEEFSVKIDKSKYHLLGHLINLPEVLPNYNKIFVFNQIKKMKKDNYALTNAHQTITTKEILGQTKCMINLKNTIKRIGSSNSTVLISGESGTGKELIARAIHSESKRCNKPFIAINCSAIPDTLLESELFGYVKGAFSGANPNGRIGKFELANEGVIFLDEIGDMPLHFQVKILRVLEDRKIVRIGSNRLIDLDIRIIAATNKDLRKLIKENKFREDLYYRLNVIPIKVPPLRNRKDDIEFITSEMIKKYNVLFNKNVEKIDEKAKEILLEYSWPGNVRELENTLEYMINIEDGSGILTKDIIPENILDFCDNRIEKVNKKYEVTRLSDIEKECILEAIEKYGNDTKGKKKAASVLGIGVATLYRRLGEKENI